MCGVWRLSSFQLCLPEGECRCVCACARVCVGTGCSLEHNVYPLSFVCCFALPLSLPQTDRLLILRPHVRLFSFVCRLGCPLLSFAAAPAAARALRRCASRDDGWAHVRWKEENTPPPASFLRSHLVLVSLHAFHVPSPLPLTDARTRQRMEQSLDAEERGRLEGRVP